VPKVNNCPSGENSPNLVTLVTTSSAPRSHETVFGVDQFANFTSEAIKCLALARRRGAVDIAAAPETRRPRFESRQAIRFLGKHSSAVVYKMTLYALFVC
jgi:hypothetical protein